MKDRNSIKKIVYESASKKFYDRKKCYEMIQIKPDDGEDIQIYNEAGFDSLDMTEFLIDIEDNLRSLFDINCIIDDDIITHDVTFRNIIDYIYNKYDGQE